MSLLRKQQILCEKKNSGEIKLEDRARKPSNMYCQFKYLPEMII